MIRRTLKVYGWTGFRSINGRLLPTREIIAAPSIMEVRRIAGLTISDWAHSGCETANEHEITLAMSKPRLVFWRELDARSSSNLDGVRRPNGG